MFFQSFMKLLIVISLLLLTVQAAMNLIGYHFVDNNSPPKIQSEMSYSFFIGDSFNPNYSDLR